MAMFCTNVWPRQTLPILLLGTLATAVGNTVLIWALDTGKASIIYGMMALMGYGIGMRMVPVSMHGLAYFPNETAVISFLGSFSFPFGGTVALTLMSTVFNNRSGWAHTDAKEGVRYAFIALAPFMWACFLLVLFLGNVWIMKDGTHEVTNGVYLWGVVRGKKLARERRSRGEDDTRVVEGATKGDMTRKEDDGSKDMPEAV